MIIATCPSVVSPPSQTCQALRGDEASKTYHVGAPANLTALQAIEHLWEATHTTGANGGALVLSTMEGVLVVQRWSRRLCGKRALALMETCVVVVCLLLVVHSLAFAVLQISDHSFRIVSSSCVYIYDHIFFSFLKAVS